MRQLLPVGLFGSFIICAMVPLTVAEEPSGAEKNIVDLYKTDKLFDKSQHKVVRAAFSQLFAEKHKERIKKAFGDDNEKLTEWLEARPDVKEDFYTALDERHDNLDAALSLFHAIWSKFPDQVEPFANVAIAIAVTWDQDRGPVYGGVVYDYSHHQVRTRSKLPGGFTDALANFSYIVEEEKKFDVRTRYLPWEFLVFVVDHRTPVEERKWAQGYFQLAKNRVKSMHQDVPYDHDMLKGERDKGSGSKPHLDGELYTLKNIRSLGGVCANQADFACRVGKSVCIPSVYCWGESSYRGLHAWSMYVNVKKATKEKIDFTLVSDGRLVGFIMDAFYTGKVIDPKSGQEMMDRDMERRLWVAGTDRAGKRQTDLIMRAYPWLCQQLKLDAKARVGFIDKCLKASSYNEAAWLAFAQMAKRKELDAGQKQLVLSHLASMNKTFADYPDFIWKVFDDLLIVQPDPNEQVKLYEEVMKLFERHGRPDLSCSARLKITRVLSDQKKWQTAAQGLNRTIRKFPTEGRYVPEMTQRLQDISTQYKGGIESLAKLYLELVPAMIVHYQDDTSEYCNKLCDQALQFMKENNLDKHAAELKLKAEQARLLTPKKR